MRSVWRCAAALARPRFFAPARITFAHDSTTLIRTVQTGRLALSPTSIRHLSTQTPLSQREATAEAPDALDVSSDGLISRFSELQSSGLVNESVIRTITEEMKFDNMTQVQTATINEALKGTDV